MGRLPLGPDGRFGWWEGDVWSASNSQRFADPYSFSHVLHGVLFYGLLQVVFRRRPLGWRATAAVLLESAWEVLENSPIIINRYREVTMALGYTGDSILNSAMDTVFMVLGFLFAARVPVWLTVAIAIFFEIFTGWLIRDNLTLNVVMLLWPVDAIKEWQNALPQM